MTDEEALRGLLAESSRAWVEQDVEALARDAGSLRGYGYRVREPRLSSAEERRSTLPTVFKGYEYFRIEDHVVDVLVDGDTAVVWGHFTEHFQNTGLPPEVVRVRFSNTAVKRDGVWRFIWGHRDAQPFDEHGRYQRQPVATSD